MLRGQRRPKPLAHRTSVLLSDQPEHLLPKLLRVTVIRRPPRAAVLQSGGPFLAIALPQSLRLPVAHLHQPPGIDHQQLLALHARQHFDPLQLPLAHLRSPQADLRKKVSLRGHFYRGEKGTLSLRFNTKPHPRRCSPISYESGSRAKKRRRDKYSGDGLECGPYGRSEACSFSMGPDGLLRKEDSCGDAHS